MQRVDIKGELKMKDFNWLKACVKWLGEVKREMTWDEHMHMSAEEKTVTYEEMWQADNDNDNSAVGEAPLFELGSVRCGFLANKAFPRHLINIWEYYCHSNWCHCSDICFVLASPWSVCIKNSRF